MSDRIGVALTPMETRREVIVETALLAESLGYEIFSLAEGWTYDSTAMLSFIAARTQRIRLLPGVLSVWSRTPAVLAMGAATLHEITGGRAILGLGTSTQTLTEAYTMSLTRVPPTNSAGSRHRFVSCSTANERRQPPPVPARCAWD